MKRCIVLPLIFAWFSSAAAVADTNLTLDAEIAAGPNFAVAAFRCWHAPEVKVLRGAVVLVPGSNADGRSQVDDPFWQSFARRHEFALVGCFFKDHPHENMNIEEYARAGSGSGQALLDAVTKFANSSGHSELATARLVLWGQSAGGEFNYEFVCWKPERVLAFVVNKGGYYFTHLAPSAARALPGIFFIGAKDSEFRIKSVEGIFAVNREAGAKWKLVIERDAGHELGKTPQLAAEFFDEVITRR